jgi:hypothetical protein
MPKASEVAQELRKVADALDLHPDVETVRPDLSFFYSFEDKQKFLDTARLFPHPVTKHYPTDTGQYSRVRVKHETNALSVETSIYRESVCIIVKPAQAAEYDCELTLSEAEDAALTEA